MITTSSELNNGPLDILNDNYLFKNELTNQTILTIFDNLYKKYREQSYDVNVILAHPAWHLICDQTIEKIHMIPKPGDLISMFKTLVYLNVPIETEICQKMLSCILSRSCALQLEQILFLSFLLKKSRHDRSKSRIVTKLKIVLPMIYQIVYMENILQYNCLQLSNILQFIAFNSDRFSLKAKTGIVHALLSHKMEFDVVSAKRIIQSLSKFPYHSLEMKLLLKSALNALHQHEIDEKVIDVVMSALDAFDEDVSFYGREIFEKFVAVLLEKNVDVTRLLALLNGFNHNVSK